MGQTTDQAMKTGAIALLSYIALEYLHASPELVLLATPIMGALLAALSKKVGDPTIASFLSPKS